MSSRARCMRWLKITVTAIVLAMVAAAGIQARHSIAVVSTNGSSYHQSLPLGEIVSRYA